MRHLKDKIELSGAGLHSGKECRLTIEPYDTAEVIMRAGGEEAPLRELSADGTKRGSDYVFPSGTRIRTCEHIFSALAGVGIYGGIKLTVDGGEMPVLDGSSYEIYRHIERHSCTDDEPLRYAEISYPVMASSEDGKRFACAFPSEEYRITYTVEYPYVGVQTYDYSQEVNYAEDIAPARTFALRSEIEYLRSHGMALGGSLKNAVIIGEKAIEAEGGLHWDNEFVRHKVLDVIGDIYSAGRPLKAHIICMRAGHELHLRLAEKLKGVMTDE